MSISLKIINHVRNSSCSLRFSEISKRFISSSEVADRRSELFTLEKNRQREKVGRIDKIEVRYLGLPEDTTLIMNKNLSTPYNCAQHLSETHCKKSALALVDSNIPWDMNRPLQDSCTLQLLHFTIADPHIVNKSFWRTCSFMLGAVLYNSFKPEADLCLHSFPSPNVKSGSFVHDFSIDHKNWVPNTHELRTFSAEMIKLSAKNIPIERLEVSHDLALEMFKDNPFKREQLPSISNQNNGVVTVYRLGSHVDISRGPMVGSTGFLGKCTISSVHKISQETDTFGLYRIQGVALPTGINLHHFAYSILEERSKKLNPSRPQTEGFEANPIAALA